MSAEKSSSAEPEQLPLSLVAALITYQDEQGQSLGDHLQLLQRLEPFAGPLTELYRLQRRHCHPSLKFLAEDVEDNLERNVQVVLTDPQLVIEEIENPYLGFLRGNWTLVMRLCESCLEIAARDPRRGLAVAKAAVTLAERVGTIYTPDEGRQLQALAWAHQANAHRIPGNLRQAENCFNIVKRCQPDSIYELPGIWAEIHWLEGSLLRDQRKLDQAKERLHLAIAQAQKGSRPKFRAAAIMNLASLDYEAGQHEEAVAKTRDVLQLLDPEEYPRWYVDACINLASYLNRCGYAQEALEQLDRHHQVIQEHGSPSDCLRAVWSQATALRSLDRITEAIARYDMARRGFMELKFGPAAAVVTLELAIVYLEQGHTAEVKRLATEILPVFEMQGIDREARATLELFRQAVAAEQVTLLQLRGWLGRLGARTY